MRTVTTWALGLLLLSGCGETGRDGAKTPGDPPGTPSSEEPVPAAPPPGLQPLRSPHGGGMPAGHGGMDSPPALPTPVAPPGMDFSGLTKPEGGFTVEELHGQRGALAGKVVRVRGRVVKFSPGIMGTNWLHVQDGTGGAGTSDLTVTSDGSAAVGDKVLVEGPLTVDQVLGHGMSYSVIVQGAKITVEAPGSDG